jgi:predicted HTH domain antitoxin
VAKTIKVILNVPENLETKTFDVSMYLASKLYEDGLLSSGQAAEMVGVSKRTFIEIMGKYGVSVFSTSVDQLSQDIENA